MTTKNHLQVGLVLKNMLSLRAQMMIKGLQRDYGCRWRLSILVKARRLSFIHKSVEKAGFKSLKAALVAASEVKGL